MCPKGKVISVYNYEIKGYDGYGEIFSLFGDIEKVKGLFINDMCLNCNIKTKQFKREGIDISFKIEGVAYVYNKEK